MALWWDLWALPQATQWDHQAYEVAAYVRCLATAEMPDAAAAMWTLVRQYGESLGLTVSGMQRLRWKVAAAESADIPAVAPRRGSARDRFKVVADE